MKLNSVQQHTLPENLQDLDPQVACDVMQDTTEQHVLCADSTQVTFVDNLNIKAETDINSFQCKHALIHPVIYKGKFAEGEERFIREIASHNAYSSIARGLVNGQLKAKEFSRCVKLIWALTKWRNS